MSTLPKEVLEVPQPVDKTPLLTYATQLVYKQEIRHLQKCLTKKKRSNRLLRAENEMLRKELGEKIDQVRSMRGKKAEARTIPIRSLSQPVKLQARI